MKRMLYSVVVQCCLLSSAVAAPLGWVDDVVEGGAKVGRKLGRETVEEGIERTIKLAPVSGKAVTRGALEASEQVVRRCPEAGRLGQRAIELEQRMPGLASQLAKEFGDDAARKVLQAVPEQQLPQLAGYAARADSPATRAALVHAATASKGKILQWLDPARIRALGLSAAAVTAAVRLTGGGGPGGAPLETTTFSMWLTSPLVLLAGGWVSLRLWRWTREERRRARTTGGSP